MGASGFLLLLFIAWAIYMIVRDRRRRRAAEQAARERHEEAAGLPAFSVSVRRSDSPHDDDGYGAFVADMWARPGVPLHDLAITRRTPHADIPCRVHSVVAGDGGSTYLNVVELGERKTYAADGRHMWAYQGREVDDSAFLGILRGASPAEALGPDIRPATPDEALSPRFDRFAGRGRKLVLTYRDAEGRVSCRAISDARRLTGGVTARCHFRYGIERTFRYDRILSLADATTGEIVEIEDLPTRRSR